jgi:mercuric reductase
MDQQSNAKEDNSDCCCCEGETEYKMHIVIIGGGSAAFAAALKADSLHCRVTMINHRLPIGGCCVNVGCVPSKTLIRAAEAHFQPSHHRFNGIKGQSSIASFKEVIEQKRELVSTLRSEKYVGPLQQLTDCRYIEGHAKLLNANEVQVNGEVIRADRIIIASGSRPAIPQIPGLSQCKFFTNENIFEVEELPKSMIVIGGGYIALECAQMFARFGSKVTILQRSSRILSKESPLISKSITQYLEEEGIEIITNVQFQSCRPSSHHPTGVSIDTSIDGTKRTFEADILLIAVGRHANTEYLNGIVELNEKGFVKVNDMLQTNVPTIFGAGDVIGEPLYVYTAAYEGALAAENAILGPHKARDYRALPWVIFTDPQVCGVGWDEEQAKEHNIVVDNVMLPLSYVPRALAARDTRGFVQLIRERASKKLLGARIVAHEGSELLGELTLAVKLGVTSDELATMFHAYLTLGEAIKLAALMFDTDISKLSCCASKM